MRTALIGWLALAFSSGITGRSQASELVPDLYVGRTVTTGVTEKHRPEALARCFVEVLVKVSGDPRLAYDEQAVKLAANAASFVRTTRYRDRLEGKPVHDEQGTRDRPHDLTVEFEPQQIDSAVRGLGREPWAAERPVLALAVFVRFGDLSYVLTQDEPRGMNQREAIDAASHRIGVPVTIPHVRDLEAANISARDAKAADSNTARNLVTSTGADLAMVGNMIFSDQVQGWIVEWYLYRPEGVDRWQVQGVSYDEAFRAGLRGAAQILSGNGRPM